MVYHVVIAWMYVVLMMAVAEATHAQGSLLGAAVTFVLYGLGPVALVVYLMGTPARRKARRERDSADRAAWLAQRAAEADPTPSGQPDAGGQPATDAVAPVRKEP